MSNHIPIPDRAFEFAVRITKICSHLDKQPGTPLWGSQKYQFKSQN